MHPGDNEKACLVWIHGGHSLSVNFDLPLRLPIKQLHPFMPLVDVVRVLSEHDTAQQLWPPLYEEVQPGQSARLTKKLDSNLKRRNLLDILEVMDDRSPEYEVAVVLA